MIIYLFLCTKTWHKNKTHPLLQPFKFIIQLEFIYAGYTKTVMNKPRAVGKPKRRWQGMLLYTAEFWLHDERWSIASFKHPTRNARKKKKAKVDRYKIQGSKKCLWLHILTELLVSLLLGSCRQTIFQSFGKNVFCGTSHSCLEM